MPLRVVFEVCEDCEPDVPGWALSALLQIVVLQVLYCEVFDNIERACRIWGPDLEGAE